MSAAIQLLMEKLGDITVQNSFNLTVSYQVDQSLLAKNFTTIINALKELQLSQQKSESQIKDLSSLKDKTNAFQQRLEKLEKNSGNSKETGLGGSSEVNDQNNNTDLTKRVEKSEGNILDNIKDINLINKELLDLKKSLNDLRNQTPHSAPGTDKGNSLGYQVSDIASNMSKELQLNAQKMKDLQARLLKAEDTINKHEKDIQELQERGNGKEGWPSFPSSGKGEMNLDELKRDLRDKLEIINRKINNLQSDSDSHEQQISDIRDILSQNEANPKQNEQQQTQLQNKEFANISGKDLNDLKRKIDEVDKRESKDIRNLLEELNNIKQQLKMQDEKIGSKSLIEEENIKVNSNRKSAIQRDDLQDKLNDLILKVNYLEKLISGSRTNLGDEKNPEKLPSINRPKRRDPNLTGFQEKDKSGISRKDLGELKAELEAWIKMLLDENKDRENYDDLMLKIQEIKHTLEKKADGEGTKKGFAFLENKITQLYLFLTEPDTEDAMIVRKGFNCLSCSKRVEKLRGKIGPKLNWNNMTTTNYSPPKVGYSKPMGEQTIDREDDV